MRASITRKLQRATDPKLGALKLRAIDVAFQRFNLKSLADLGAVWAVDAGYSLYAVDKHGASRSVICDDDFTEPVSSRAERDDRIELVRGNFGSEEVAAKVDRVDTILMFDILLHQVRPDWDQIIDLYSERCQSMILAGPWWNGPRTERLLDLGADEYLGVVPMPEFHAKILEKIDEVNEKRGRQWRDVHDIWQWGITARDLTAKMNARGFELAHFENLGEWRGLARFDDCAFVFVRPELLRSHEAS